MLVVMSDGLISKGGSMKLRYLLSRIVLLLGIGCVLAACGGKTLVESNLGLKGAPNWVNKGTQVLKDDGGRLIHGVGMASPLGDISLQGSTADDRARAEVARILSTVMDVVSSDYMASAGKGSSEEAVSRQIKSTTKVMLNGVKIIARWRDPKTGNLFSLAEMDMKQTKELVKNMDEINADLRAYFAKESDNVFDRIAAGGGRK